MASSSSNAPSTPRPRSENISADVKEVVDNVVRTFAEKAASNPTKVAKDLQAFYGFVLGNYLTLVEVIEYAKNTKTVDEKKAARCFANFLGMIPENLSIKYVEETTKAYENEQKEKAKKDAEECRTKSGDHTGSSPSDA